MKRLVIAYESEESCRTRLRNLEQQAARDVANYLAQASDLQEYRTTISKAFGTIGVEVLFFDIAHFDTILNCLQEQPQSTMLWTLTDGFRYYRGSHLSCVAELLGVSLYGSPPPVQLSCQDKFRCLALAKTAGLRVPPACLLRGSQLLTPRIKAPHFFVKPNTLGAKIGIFGDAKTDNWESVIDLSKRIHGLYGDDVLVQEFIPGADVRVSYMNLGKAYQPGVYRLAGAEAGEVGGEFLTMKDNWTLSALTDRAPAFQPRMVPLECKQTCEGILEQVETLKRLVGLKDYFSFDFRLAPDGQAYFLEFEVCPAVTIHDFQSYLRETHDLTLVEALVRSTGVAWENQV